MIINSRNLGVIKKHIALVHSGSKLSLLSRKIANVLLFNSIKTKDPYQGIYNIKIGNLAALTNYNSHDYRKLKMALLMLVKTPVEWNIFDEQIEEQVEWGVSGFLASAMVRKQGLLEYSYSPHFLNIILEPQKYALINLEESLQLTSQYSICLYENCIRYIGVGQTPWWKIEDLRRLTGAYNDLYHNFEDFKKRVLDFSLNDINQKCNIKIIMKLQKIHRKPDSIKFIVKKISKCFSLDLHTKLKSIFKLSKDEIDNLIEKFGADKIEEKVAYIINSNSYKNQGIKSLGSYLMSALENNYMVTKDAKQALYSLPQIPSYHQQRSTSIKINQEALQDNIKKIILFIRPRLHLIPITYKDLFIFSIKNNELCKIFIDKGFDSDEVMQKLITFYKDQWHTLIPSDFWNLYYEKI
ncbi:MAG: replication initiation protein [Gammaproteobacteria bacterium]